MEKIQLENVTLFKEEFLGGLAEHALYGTSDELGNWVSFNDIINLLGFNRNLKKKVRRRINENDKCFITFKRIDSFENEEENEELFIRDSAVYEIIMKDKEERKVTEQFIFDVLGQLNGGKIQSYIDIKYAKEIEIYKDWLESDNDMFIAHKEDNEIHTWSGPSIDEALDILYKAGLNE